MTFNKKSHWQTIYSDKDPLDVSWYQKRPSISLDLINQTQVSKDQGIIDIGGGASVLVDHLYDDGFTNIAVLDISENALNHAKKRLGDYANKIEWIETDITQFETAHSYFIWHDRAVFHFLTEQSDREKYINTLKNTLCEGGHLIIAAFAIGGPEKCSGLDIAQYDAKKITAELGTGFKLLEQRSEIHKTPTNTEQSFNYFHFIKA